MNVHRHCEASTSGRLHKSRAKLHPAKDYESREAERKGKCFAQWLLGLQWMSHQCLISLGGADECGKVNGRASQARISIGAFPGCTPKRPLHCQDSPDITRDSLCRINSLLSGELQDRTSARYIWRHSQLPKISLAGVPREWRSDHTVLLMPWLGLLCIEDFALSSREAYEPCQIAPADHGRSAKTT